MFASRRKSANVVGDDVGGVGASIAAAMLKGVGGCVRKNRLFYYDDGVIAMKNKFLCVIFNAVRTNHDCAIFPKTGCAIFPKVQSRPIVHIHKITNKALQVSITAHNISNIWGLNIFFWPNYYVQD